MGWEQYKNGFGHPNGTYWLGLERMHQMTSTGKWQLALVVRVLGNQQSFNHIVYDNFKIGSELLGYKLTIGSVSDIYGPVIGFLASEDRSDLLSYNNRAPFSTKD